MNKAGLVDQVADEMKITKHEAQRAVEAVIAAIKDGVRDESKVAIAGFGTFQKKSRAARTGINPTTRQPIRIEATTTCTFKPAPALKDSLEGMTNGPVQVEIKAANVTANGHERQFA